MYLLQWLTVATAVRSEGSHSVRSCNELLVAQFSDHGLGIFSARRHRGAWQAEDSFFIPVDFENTPSDPKHTAGLIQQELERRRIQTSHVLVLINRRKLLLKQCEVTSVAKDQLAAAVGLQAEARGYRRDEYVVDFLSPEVAEGGNHQVLMAVYPRVHLDWIQEVSHQLGWKLLGASVGELDVLKFAGFSAERGLGVCILAQRDRLEFIVGDSQQPLMLYSVNPEYDANKLPLLLQGIFRRLQSAVPDAQLPRGFQQIAVFGERAAEVAVVLTKKLQLSAKAVSTPWENSPEAWASLFANETSLPVINFAQPRQSPDHQKLRRAHQRRWLTRAALVAVLAVLCQQWWIKQLDQQLIALEAKHRTLKQTTGQQQETLDAEARLLQWMHARIELPSKIAMVLGSLPSNERTYLHELRVDCPEDQPAQVTLHGFARSPDDALQVTRSLLMKSDQFTLQPEQLERNENDPHYQTSFEVLLNLRESPTTEETEP